MLGGYYVTHLVTLGHLGIILLWKLTHVCGDGVIVDTDKGRIRGFSDFVDGKKLDIFYGIPYAAPPVGERRYRRPEQVDPWEGVIDATELPNSCFQNKDTHFGEFIGAAMWNPNTPVSEDCLYLNIWVPRTNPPYKDKAVLVWIYGGGFYSGSSTLDIYQPSYLAVENDVVVVSMQYRVGSLGFLTLDTEEAPGNVGLWDQKLALEWVSRNIHNFSGDPHKVTLMGESAGAVSVGLFLLCDSCASLFHGAILQSGSPYASWGVLPKEIMRKRSETFAEKLGCDQQTDHEYLLRCLRSVTYNSSVIAKEPTVITGIMQFAFVPVVDGDFIRKDPAQLLRSGHFKKIPILLGSNENEGTSFIVYMDGIYNLQHSPVISPTTYNILMRTSMFKYYPHFPYTLNDFGMEAIQFHYKDWLNPDNEAALSLSIDRAVSDYYFVCPVNELARTYAKHKMPVFYYWFSQRWSANPWPPYMGVVHGDEIWFTFGQALNESHSFTEEEKQLSRKMMTYWTNYAKTG